MSKLFAAMGVALSLYASAAPLQAAEDRAKRAWPTLDEVTASSPVRDVVKVGCDNAMWPTARQVARYTRIDSEDGVLPLRRHIVASGRAACATGFTHVLIVFKAPLAEVAVVPVAERPSRGG